jgi:hypothetical protein
MESGYEMEFRARREVEGGAGCSCPPKRPGTYLILSRKSLAYQIEVGVIEVLGYCLIDLESGEYWIMIECRWSSGQGDLAKTHFVESRCSGDRFQGGAPWHLFKYIAEANLEIPQSNAVCIFKAL